MILVVDTNIIIAAALKRSVTQDLVFNSALQLYTPEFVKDEIQKHKEELLEKGGYSEEEFNIILSIVFLKITIVPQSEYKNLKNEVLDFSPDKNDWPFLALAKHLDAAVWSNDNDLKIKQNAIRVFATSELIKLLEGKHD